MTYVRYIATAMDKTQGLRLIQALLPQDFTVPVLAIYGVCDDGKLIELDQEFPKVDNCHGKIVRFFRPDSYEVLESTPEGVNLRNIEEGSSHVVRGDTPCLPIGVWK